VAIDLNEYLFSANQPPFTENVDSKLIPYGVSPVTQQDVLASFPTSLQQQGIFATTVSVSAVTDILNNPIFACPVSGARASFGSNPRTVLGIGDSFTVRFASTIEPARVKICGQYQPQAIVNNGIAGQYTFTHTVQDRDISGPCSVMVYLPWQRTLLAVYEVATGLIVGTLRSCFQNGYAHE